MLKYNRGHINPWWDNSFKQLDYVYPELTNTYDVETWNQMGYHGFHYGGAIVNENQKQPDYTTKFLEIFCWQNQAVQYFLLNTMDAVPPHRDGYPGYALRNNIFDKNQIHRAVIFLEDWQSGHYFEIDNQPIVNWRAGDWISWQNDTLHFAANIGTAPRYTLQITGTLP